MSRENVETVRRGYELLAAGDVEGMVALVDPDFELRPVVAGAMEDAVYRGPEGVRQYAKDIAETWERFEQVPQRFIERGDDVLVTLHIDARGKGSGVELSMEAAVLFTFRDGKVLRGIGFTDVGKALEAVGVSE